MEFFLRLRAWQLFALLLVPTLFATMLIGDTINFKLMGLLTLLISSLMFGWLFSVGFVSNNKLPEHLKKSTTIYISGFIFAVSYMFIAFAYIFPDLLKNPQTVPSWFFMAHMMAMFGVFYGLWFTAKQFVTLQKERTVTFSEYSSTLFMFWFFPIGVWFIQPKINEWLYKTTA